ncbi:MAG: hypothetical protein GDA52_10220 [Rhodobacteraceae bacterium]|nr:hypothetical protein [Paracoccaceae bacterium]
MRAIIHIGMPKVGSSSIQAWLRLNKSALAEQGVVYDRLAAPGARSEGQAELSVCVYEYMDRMFSGGRVFMDAIGVRDRESQRAFVQSHMVRFRASVQAAQGRVYVISSEGFQGNHRTEEEITGLDQFLSEFFEEVRYVLYFRRQEDYAPSKYCQILRRGQKKSLKKVTHDIIKNDYFTIVECLAAVVGREALDVRLLEPDTLIGGNLLADFATVLGVDQSGFTIPDYKNTSLSRAAIEILQAHANKHPAFIQDNRHNPDVRELVNVLTKLDRDRGYEKWQLTQRDITQIREACAEDNERLRMAWFPDRTELFPEHPPVNPVSEAKVVKQVAELSIALYESALTMKSKRQPSPQASGADGSRDVSNVQERLR